jgi:hypothetical protein
VLQASCASCTRGGSITAPNFDSRDDLFVEPVTCSWSEQTVEPGTFGEHWRGLRKPGDAPYGAVGQPSPREGEPWVIGWLESGMPGRATAAR